MLTGFALVDWVLGALVTVGGLYTAYALGRKALADAKSTAEPQTPYEALSSRTLHLEKQVSDIQAERTYLIADIGTLKSRLHVIEEDRDTLADGLHVIAEWDDAGRPDPPGYPGIATHVRAVLRRLHDPSMGRHGGPDMKEI